jgi:rhamnulokinase
MSSQQYLAIDLGAESGRVMVGAFDGGRLQLAELHRFRNGPVLVGDSLRWNILGLWSEIQEGLAKAAARHADVVSLGADTWGVDYVLFDQYGEMIGQPYCYRDARTSGVMDAALNRVPRGDVFAVTGLQFMPINTLYQLLAMRSRQPELLARARRFLMIPDVLHWLLSGSQSVEFTNATTTQCLDATTRNWATDLLRRFELPTEPFPNIVSPGTSLGRLRASVADQCRSARWNVVAPATHDTGSAVVAVPTEQTGTAKWAYISSGTWSLMGLELPHAVLTPQALAHNVTNEGGIDGTYRLLKNIMGLWLVQECKRSFARDGRDLSYDELTHSASNSEPFRTLIDPDAPEFLSPADMPAAISQWCQKHGQPIPTTPGQFVRCALESLALKYRTVLGWLEELSGERVQVVHVVGGGSQNNLLNQFTANACGRPVFAGPVEATAMGNVLVQMRTAGAVSSLSQMREIVRRSSMPLRLEPQDVAAWQSAANRFDALLTAT